MPTRQDHVPLRFEVQTEENKQACILAAQQRRERRAAKEPLDGRSWKQVEADRAERRAKKLAIRANAERGVFEPRPKKPPTPSTTQGDWLLSALRNRAKEKPTWVQKPRPSYLTRTSEENMRRLMKAQEKRRPATRAGRRAQPIK